MTTMSCDCEIKKKLGLFTCSKCGNSFCAKHTYMFVDESFRAITPQYHCEACSEIQKK